MRADRIKLALTDAILRRTFRPLWARGLSAAEMRGYFHTAVRLGTFGRRLPPVHEENIDGLAVEWIGERAAAARGMLVWIHGGSFAIRPARSDRLLCADLARRSGLPVALLAYRLAPEFPFPAALEDCQRLFARLLERGIPAERIVFAGHSAGANLVASTLMRLRRAGLPQPAGAVLLSGCFDLTGPSAQALAIEPLDAAATVDIWPWTRRQYLHGTAADHPDASPSFGNWTGLAPLHFQVTDCELSYDSVKAAAERARAAGVEVTLTVWRGMSHFYPGLDMLEDGQRCRDEIAKFAIRVLSRTDRGQVPHSFISTTNLGTGG